jgi:hypothetical protein
MKKEMKNMKGGDGYAVNVGQAIAGRPSYIRYTDNCKPVFNGSLLQNGGSASQELNPSSIHWNDPTEGINNPLINQIQNNEVSGGVAGFNLKNYEHFMLFGDNSKEWMKGGNEHFMLFGDNSKEWMKGGNEHFMLFGNNSKEWMQGGGGKEKNCNCDKKEDDIFDLLKQNQRGGFLEAEGLSQFKPIQAISKVLSPLGTGALTATIVLIFLHYYMKKKNKSKRAIMMGGFSSSLESVLAPLGKQNLLVLASILLLHHFAMKKLDKSKTFKFMSKSGKQRGGSSITPILQNLLAPLGLNALGASIILVAIQQGFKKNVFKSDKRKSSQEGGLSLHLQKLIQPLSADQFVANGVFHQLEKLFYQKVKEEENKKNRYHQNVKKEFNELFETLGPIGFSTFANDIVMKKSEKIRDTILSKNK